MGRLALGTYSCMFNGVTGGGTPGNGATGTIGTDCAVWNAGGDGAAHAVTVTFGHNLNAVLPCDTDGTPNALYDGTNGLSVEWISLSSYAPATAESLGPRVVHVDANHVNVIFDVGIAGGINGLVRFKKIHSIEQ